MRRILFGLSAGLVVVVSLAASRAQESASIAGRWRCDRFCFIWDTGASIKIDGEYAVCENERGDLSKGRLLTKRSVQCFDIVGQLSDDNESIEWSNGNLWRRDHSTAF
jgi:hypothetical protein